jgi:hypothetical protein
MGDAFQKRWVNASNMRTICEVLREIYWETEDPVIREKLDEAQTMAKKMHRRLVRYRNEYVERTGCELPKDPMGYKPNKDMAKIKEERIKKREREDADTH